MLSAEQYLQALVAFAGPKCHNLCHDYDDEARNNPVQHQTKPKRVLYFNSICRAARRVRTSCSCQPKDIKGNQQLRPRKQIEIGNERWNARERNYHSQYRLMVHYFVGSGLWYACKGAGRLGKYRAAQIYGTKDCCKYSDILPSQGRTSEHLQQSVMP